MGLVFRLEISVTRQTKQFSWFGWISFSVLGGCEVFLVVSLLLLSSLGSLFPSGCVEADCQRRSSHGCAEAAASSRRQLSVLSSACSRQHVLHVCRCYIFNIAIRFASRMLCGLEVSAIGQTNPSFLYCAETNSRRSRSIVFSMYYFSRLPFLRGLTRQLGRLQRALPGRMSESLLHVVVVHEIPG